MHVPAVVSSSVERLLRRVAQIRIDKRSDLPVENLLNRCGLFDLPFELAEASAAALIAEAAALAPAPPGPAAAAALAEDEPPAEDARTHLRCHYLLVHHPIRFMEE